MLRAPTALAKPSRSAAAPPPEHRLRLDRRADADSEKSDLHAAVPRLELPVEISSSLFFDRLFERATRRGRQSPVARPAQNAFGLILAATFGHESRPPPRQTVAHRASRFARKTSRYVTGLVQRNRWYSVASRRWYQGGMSFRSDADIILFSHILRDCFARLAMTDSPGYICARSVPGADD